MTFCTVFKTFLLAAFAFDTVAWFKLVGLQLMYPSKIQPHDSIITTKHFVCEVQKKESVILMF